jgi:hydroxymethylpyrimidine pyrophosphatase-like HAD family hydrolase
MRCVYLDLDGTLLGAGASIVHDGDGNVSLAAMRAIEACHRAGVQIVLVSGRREAQVREDTRLLGGSAYAFESGACLVIGDEREWLTGPWKPGELSIHEQIEESGAGRFLLERYAGRLEHHEPWHTGREVSHLYRGVIDAEEATNLLAENGFDGLRLCDNGSVHHRTDALTDLGQLRAYHLVPAGATKRGAVARHRQIAGLAAEDCVAVGDGREDLAIAPEVSAMWLVANAFEADPQLQQIASTHPNVRVCEESNGAGVYEAVVTTLAERRG